MRLFFCVILFYLHYGEAKLWSKGIVHYAINKKDFDPHSQEIIATTFGKLEKEICVRFFNTPFNHSMGNNDRILYISNPDKRKECPTESYDFDKTVVDMHIGYKCLNEDDISMVVLDMLRASIGMTESPNSIDLYKTFRAVQKKDTKRESLLLASDRDNINTHYFEECEQSVLEPVSARRSYTGKTLDLTTENEEFYKDKLWPLGIVMYEVDQWNFPASAIEALENAMQVIELASCIVFQRTHDEEQLQPKNLVYFGREGEDMPHLGFLEGNQTVLLSSVLSGAPGHSAHTLNVLFRILGIPMMSNRYDRAHYVQIHWDKVTKTKEHHLERLPLEAWIKDMEGEGSAYDFDSVTHAPANYMCDDCSRGEQTVEPLQDYLWQRSLSMGHRKNLSPADIELLNLIYNRECQMRFSSNI